MDDDDTWRLSPAGEALLLAGYDTVKIIAFCEKHPELMHAINKVCELRCESIRAEAHAKPLPKPLTTEDAMRLRADSRKIMGRKLNG